MTDERKDGEHRTEPKPTGDEHVSDIKSKNLDEEKEGKVKGGRKTGKGQQEYFLG